eukprot:CAMPEP_0181184460 /NCGR_PEP_ID=MMETSP1096-20121128/8979_1 /TAXON_ID=156174 ORGANISM="Chrysochromulina ericina, Strain CCMP281" /NCGR_SAMPLE_ID=MMETSP1096 /ASSEMBLY_ACC=CAM_ASM_000453 /LENGTH=85 /DNA_ID=CAMNT_0023273225 /DNA_START=414 /DNA_END=668 /DNA_ORIENTATION=+
MKHSLPKYPYRKIASRLDPTQQHVGASPWPQRPLRDSVSTMASGATRLRWLGMRVLLNCGESCKQPALAASRIRVRHRISPGDFS